MLSLSLFSHFCSFMVIRRLGFKGWGLGLGCRAFWFLFGGSLYKHRGKCWEKTFAKIFVIIIGVLSVLISNLALFLSSGELFSMCWPWLGHYLAKYRVKVCPSKTVCKFEQLVLATVLHYEESHSQHTRPGKSPKFPLRSLVCCPIPSSLDGAVNS